MTYSVSLRGNGADAKDMGRKRWWKQEVLDLARVRAEAVATQEEGVEY